MSKQSADVEARKESINNIEFKYSELREAYNYLNSKDIEVYAKIYNKTKDNKTKDNKNIVEFIWFCLNDKVYSIQHNHWYGFDIGVELIPNQVTGSTAGISLSGDESTGNDIEECLQAAMENKSPWIFTDRKYSSYVRYPKSIYHWLNETMQLVEVIEIIR